jgi:hypothetical protein
MDSQSLAYREGVIPTIVPIMVDDFGELKAHSRLVLCTNVTDSGASR